MRLAESPQPGKDSTILAAGKRSEVRASTRKLRQSEDDPRRGQSTRPSSWPLSGRAREIAQGKDSRRRISEIDADTVRGRIMGDERKLQTLILPKSNSACAEIPR
jgi:hypothetical protein